MLNLTGGGGAKKAKLVADVTAEIDKLNASLTKTVALTDAWAKNIKKAKGAGAGSGGGGGSMEFGSSPPPPISGGGTGGYVNPSNAKPGGVTSGGYINPPGTDSMSWKSVGKDALGSLAAGASGMAASTAQGFMAAIKPSDFVTNDMARRSYGFYSGLGGNAGAAAGSMAFRSMMNNGTATSSLDAANAAMMGASNGLMPSMSNAYKGAAGVSNIMPGVGLEGGMEAQAALNKASSVNKLRMIGIQVRDANGMPRAVEDVARQIWTQLKTMTGGDGRGAITAKDLDFALQSGNSLDSMLNQYFGNDPILRQSVIRYLYQFASGHGTSKKELEKTGANPAISQSMGKRNAAAYGAIDAYTNAGVKGVIDANSAIASIAKNVEAMAGNPLFQMMVQGSTFLQTFSGGANGGLGNILGGLFNWVGPAMMMIGKKGLSSIFEMIKTGGKGLFTKAADWAKGAWSKVADWGKGFWAKAGEWAKGAWGKVAEWGKGAWDWIKGLFGGGKGTAAAKTGETAAEVAGKVAPRAGIWGASQFLGPLSIVMDVLSLSGDTQQVDPNAPKPKPSGKVPFAPSFGVDPNKGKSSPLDDLFGNHGGEGGDGQLAGMGDGGVANPVDNYTSKITSQWGVVRHLVVNGKSVTTKPHGGMDIGVPEGTSVKAAKDGEVIHTGYNPDGFGHNVIIQHADGYQTLYGHLSSKAMQKGDKVTAGQLVGLSGNTGFSTGPHLHFQVQKEINGKTYDPAAYITGSTNLESSSAASGVHSDSAANDAVTNALFSSSSGSLFSGVKPKNGTGGSESSDPTILPTRGAMSGGNNITVHINVPAGAAINEHTLAREVKRILQEDERVKMAVNR
ncbi:Peptidase M23 [uncultured Caudovirales phage]|uniref:Peptidase M23 n=1 Tax=uncultured Caudovirales phage TaxID=2100421 RepID=A0A6J7WQH0_9CAUD|nr:Peptidase M23 [uncultured Caudovirales phage]CAB5218975.1 Peptidase M23 [uncultured Caudovirales phage]